MKTRTASSCLRLAKAAGVATVLTLAWISTPDASAQLGSLIVTITSPSSGATVSGTIPVNADVTIIGSLTVQYVQFKLDGVNLGAADTTSPYSIQWNTTTASNGSHTLTAVARDILGINWSSDPVTVTVSNDTTPPTVAITSPASGAAVRGTIAVNANASDNVGVAGVQFKLDGANLGAEDTASPYSVSWNTTTASEGSHTLTAVARDAAGNTTTSSAVTVTVDNTPPTVTINQAAGQADPTSTSPINFTVVFSEAVSGFAAADVTISGTAGGTKTVVVSGGPVTYNVAVSGMTGSGTVTASIVAGAAVDGAGNASTASTSTDNTVTFSAPDTTPPTVAITSPASGAAVRGTITVSANASDNAGVVGVQFQLDGANLGAEVTTSPYSISWDTTTAAEGSHTLTAIARDAAGNAPTSAPVTVTVTTGSTPPTATRFEDTDLSITYTDGIDAPGRPSGWWHGSRSRGWSGVIASFNRSQGARARFSFTGTTVRWIGFLAPWAGIADVYVDDVFAVELDLYATTEQAQAVVFERTGLPSGNHTITVEAEGRKNDASTDYAVVVDAFDVEPTSPLPTTGMRVEETGLTFTAGWTTAAPRAWSGGTAQVSSTPGEQATLTFIGTEVRWMGLRGPQSGIARVYLDGAFQSTVDTYAPTDIQAVVFTATGLADGPHTFTVDVSGQKNAASTDSLVIVDAFDVTLSPSAPTITRYQETDPATSYTGTWSTAGLSFWSGETASYSGAAGDTATFTFTGTAVRWIGQRAFTGGIANVFLDGVFQAQVDTYVPLQEEYQAAMYVTTGLANTSHTLAIEVTGQKNPFSQGTWVFVDAFDVF